MSNNSRILAVEASILLKGIGYNDKQALAFIADHDIVVPLDVFKNEYTKAFHAGTWFDKWMAKEQYLNLTKGEIQAAMDKASKKGKL